MKRDDYLQLITNNELIQRALKPKDDAMFALIENNVRLARIAKYDNDLNEEDRDKMPQFCISKAIHYLETKGLEFEEALEIVSLVAVGINVQDNLHK